VGKPVLLFLEIGLGISLLSHGRIGGVVHEILLNFSEPSLGKCLIPRIKHCYDDKMGQRMATFC
jgi:hypothetical protein